MDWIKYAQRTLVTIDETNMMKLNPFVDKQGIKRLYCRLQMSQVFDYDRIHPIILPNDSYISKLIVEDAHKQSFHPGHLRIIAECRRKYWIMNIRKLAKQIGSKCTVCRRWRRKACNQIMSNLPEYRIMPGGSPFQFCAVLVHYRCDSEQEQELKDTVWYSHV